ERLRAVGSDLHVETVEGGRECLYAREKGVRGRFHLGQHLSLGVAQPVDQLLNARVVGGRLPKRCAMWAREHGGVSRRRGAGRSTRSTGRKCGGHEIRW